MNKRIALLLMDWVVELTTLIVGQSNIFPHKELEELCRCSDALLKAIREESR